MPKSYIPSTINTRELLSTAIKKGIPKVIDETHQYICQKIKSVFRVLGIYNFGNCFKLFLIKNAGARSIILLITSYVTDFANKQIFDAK